MPKTSSVSANANILTANLIIATASNKLIIDKMGIDTAVTENRNTTFKLNTKGMQVQCVIHHSELMISDSTGSLNLSTGLNWNH